MKVFSILLLVFCLLTTDFCGAQDADSLKSIWTDEQQPAEERLNATKTFYSTYVDSRPKEVLNASLTALKIAEEQGDVKKILSIRNNRSHAFQNLGMPDSMLLELTISKELAIQTTDSVWLVAILGNIGNIKQFVGDYAGSMEAYKTSLKFSKRNNYTSLHGNALLNIGLTYMQINANDLGYQYLDSALQFFHGNEKLEHVPTILLHMAIIETDRGNHENALKLCKETNGTFDSVNNRRMQAQKHSIISEAYEGMGQLDSAEVYIRSSIDIIEEMGNNNLDILYAIQLMNIIKDERSEEASMLLDKIESTLEDVNDIYAQDQAYTILYDKYKLSGNATKALEIKELQLANQEVLANEEEHLSIVRQGLDEKYRAEIQKNEAEDKAAREVLVSGQRMRLAGITLLSLAAIATLLWFMRKRNIRQENEKNVLLAELEEFKTKVDVVTAENEAAGQVKVEQPPLETFHLDKEKIERSIERQLNETDWNVLTLLAEDPVQSNKEIAERAFISVDGIGSALRRMYVYFEVKESKYKKISLLLEAVKLSRP